MSRIGNKTITIPSGVEVDIKAGNEVTVKGPKGELTQTFNPNLSINIEDNTISVVRPNDTKLIRQLHGTTRALLFNMIEGVHNGFKKELEIIGIGFRAAITGSKLVLNIGYSHPVEFEIPKELTVTVDKNTKIAIEGINKQQVGEFAANVRAQRKPEPYLGKGIRYKDEHVRRKEGKTAKK